MKNMLNRQEMIDKTVAEIAKDKKQDIHQISTYDVALRLADKVVKLLPMHDVSQQSKLVCSCKNKLTDKELYYGTCLKCGNDVDEQTCG